MTDGKFAALLAKQMPDAEKRRRADFILDSSQGFDHTRAQIRDILKAVAKMETAVICRSGSPGTDGQTMREIVFDTETTGLDPMQGDRLVEIGCIELINRFPSGKTFHCLLQSGTRHAGAGFQDSRPEHRIPQG